MNIAFDIPADRAVEIFAELISELAMRMHTEKTVSANKYVNDMAALYQGAERDYAIYVMGKIQADYNLYERGKISQCDVEQIIGLIGNSANTKEELKEIVRKEFAEHRKQKQAEELIRKAISGKDEEDS